VLALALVLVLGAGGCCNLLLLGSQSCFYL
jgi:hypothetical protein